MNKKAFFKIWVLSIIFILIGLSFIFIFNLNSIYASELKENYLLNDRLKLNVAEDNLKIKIETPSKTSIVKPDSEIILKLNELGKYKITFYGDELKEFNFNVVENLPEINNITNFEIINGSSENISKSNSFTDLNNSKYFNSQIKVGEKVVWKKDFYSKKDLELEISNISYYAQKIDYNLSDLEKNGRVELSYETPAPEKSERKINKFNKEVRVFSDLHYINVTAFTNIEEITSDKSKILIYWQEEEEYLEFKSYDTNNNSLIDYIEWIVPHLSNQTFQIIIITKAEHLDSNREFLSDIYSYVSTLDGNWSEKISDGEYVRVKFESNLTNVNDITIFPKIISGKPKIEIYEQNGESIIAEFKEVNDYQFNKVILSRLIGEQDSFDLRVVGGEVEFDYIVDPTFITGNEAHDISFAILNETNGMYVMAWCDDTADSAAYAIRYTNGSIFGTVQTFDAGAGDSCRVSVSALNATAFSISYIDWVANSADWILRGYSIQGTSLWGPTSIDADMNSNVDIDVSAWNSTNYVSAVIDDTDNQATFVIYNIGTQVVAQTDIVTNSPDTACLDQDCISVSALNNTAWIVSYFDEDDDNIYYSMYRNAGTQIIAPTIVSASALDGAVGSAALKNGGFVIAYCDSTDDDISFITYSSSGASVSGEIDVNQTVSGCGGAASTHVGVSALNTTDGQFVIFYDNSIDDRSYFAIYNYTGAEILPNTFVSLTDTVEKTAIVSAYDKISGKELCYYTDEDVFLVGYNNVTDAVWENFYVNGSSWDGDCRDKLSPEIVLSSPLNNTITNVSLVSFVCNLTDKSQMSNVTFYVWNSSEIYNQTTRVISGLTNSSSLNMTLQSNSYNWSCYATDSFNNRGFASYNHSIIVDQISPQINFTNPTEINNSLLNKRNIIVNVTAVDLLSGLRNITVNLYNSSGIVNSSNSTISPLYINFSVQLDGIYYFNVTAFDIINNTNRTETRQIRVDTVNPLVNIISPVNRFNYTSSTINFNISSNENSSALYTLNNGINNYTMLANSSGTGFGAINNSIADGNYLVRFYVNDSAGNRNYTQTSNFTMDRNGPAIFIDSPIVNNEYNFSNVLFNFSFSDLTYLYNSWFYFNSTNYSYSSPVYINIVDGNYTLFVYANDSLGNINFSSLNFSVNKFPNITFFNNSGLGINGNTTILQVNNGLYDMKIEILGLKYPLFIYGFNKSSNQSLIYSNYTNEFLGNESFAISFEGMAFSSANITYNASATHLYKCNDWNMTSLSCINNDSWDVVSLNQVGNLYNLTLNSTDPGFVQLNIAESEIFEDGYAIQSSPAIEYGARTVMIVANSTGANSYSLISFNMSKIPAGVIIDSSNIILRCSAETLETGESLGIGVHTVYSSYVWNEGTGGNGGNTCSPGEYCFNNKPLDSQYNNTFDSSLQIPDGCSGTSYSFNVLNSIKYAYSQNYRNISLYILPTGNNVGTITGDEVRFSTKEATVASSRPILNISYHSIPQVRIISPNASTNFSAFEIAELRVNATDVATNISLVYANVTLPNGTVNRYSLVNISNQIYSYNYTAPSLYGRYNVTFYANNSDNYINGTENTWFIVADFSAPNIYFENPSSNSSNFGKNIIVNVTAIDLLSGLANISVFLHNSSGIVNLSNSTISPLYINFSALLDGIYYFNSSACDNSANCNYTETRNFTIDNTYPLINYGLRTEDNEGNFSRSWIYINVSVIEINEANITFNLYNSTGLVNSTSYFVQQRTINWTDLVNGTYYYNVTIIDLASNINYTLTRIITLDTEIPVINYISDDPDPVINASFLNVSANVTDNLNVGRVFVEIEGVNYTLSHNSGNIYNVSINTSIYSIGYHNYTVYANDSVGNIANYKNGTFRTVYDYNPPVINYISDDPDPTVFTRMINITTNVTDDTEVEEVVVEIEGVNYTLSYISGDIYGNNQISTSDVGVGFFNYIVYAKDTSGYYTNSSRGNFTVNEGNYITNVSIRASNPSSVDWDRSGPYAIIMLNPLNYSVNVTFVNISANSTGAVFASITQGAGNSFPTTGWVLTNNREITWSGNYTIPQEDAIGFYITATSNKVGETFRVRYSAVINNSNYADPHVHLSAQSSTNGIPFASLAFDNTYPHYNETLRGNSAKTFSISMSETTGRGTIGTGTVLSIIIPEGFTNIVSNGGTGWGSATISGNVINVTNTATVSNSRITYSFNATAPAGTAAQGLYTMKSYLTGTNTNAEFEAALKVFDGDAPVINLYQPFNRINLTGFIVSPFNYSVTDASTLSSCQLWGNWSGNFEIKQTVNDPIKNIVNNFTQINTTDDGFYIWNIECTDQYGNTGFNSTNYTFGAFELVSQPVLGNSTFNINDGTGNLTLYWGGALHASSYKIYRSRSLSENFVLVNSTIDRNYTDYNFSGNRRMFYKIESVNPVSSTNSSDYFGAHVYTLSHTTNTKNWIGFPSNSSLLRNATSALNEIRNATAFTMWNSTIQKRVTCNSFSCPYYPSCTENNCNFNIDPGIGYEVNINSSTPASINWSMVGVVYNKVNISLVKNSTGFGKNWIAMYANTSLINAQTLYGNITGADAVSKWNETSQISQGLVRNPLPIGPPYLGNNFNLLMESGYEVSVNISTNFSQR